MAVAKNIEGNIKTCRNIAQDHWGEIQTEEMLKDGVFCFTTAGHGGYVVDGTTFNIDKIPKRFFPNINKKFAVFEEDCDWAVLFYCYPELSEEYYKNAINTHSPIFYEKYPTHQSFFNECVVGSLELYHKDLFLTSKNQEIIKENNNTNQIDMTYKISVIQNLEGVHFYVVEAPSKDVLCIQETMLQGYNLGDISLLFSQPNLTDEKAGVINACINYANGALDFENALEMKGDIAFTTHYKNMNELEKDIQPTAAVWIGFANNLSEKYNTSLQEKYLKEREEWGRGFDINIRPNMSQNDQDYYEAYVKNDNRVIPWEKWVNDQREEFICSQISYDLVQIHKQFQEKDEEHLSERVTEIKSHRLSSQETPESNFEFLHKRELSKEKAERLEKMLEITFEKAFPNDEDSSAKKSSEERPIIENLKVFKETDKAVLVKIAVAGKPEEKTPAWLPKSQVSVNKSGYVFAATKDCIAQKGLTIKPTQQATPVKK